MTQLDQLLTEMEKHGWAITTSEILSLNPRIAQYNRAISDLKHKGYEIICEPIKNQRGNNIFRVVGFPRNAHLSRMVPPLDRKPSGCDELFNFKLDQHGNLYE